MINTGDELVCTDGNNCYVEGEVYTVGDFINERFFEIMTGNNNERWYATKDSKGIYIPFDANKKIAWFDELKHYTGA